MKNRRTWRVGVSRNLNRLLMTAFLFVAAHSFAESAQAPASAKETAIKFYEHLRAGDAESMDPLFFRVPIMESNEAAWLALLETIAQMVKDEQSDWEVICAKEMPEMAIVIINQVMKHGKKHGDPDAMYLVPVENRWLILPDLVAPNTRREVESSLSLAQRQTKITLMQWGIGEIRGYTDECVRSQEPDSATSEAGS